MANLSKALPIIVSNYSKLFGVTVRMQGRSAYTNGRTINIPRLDLNKEYYARMAYGYLAHEAAHIRYTDFEIVKESHSQFFLFVLFNILEDSRIEKIIGREFVGVWENLELLRQAQKKEWQTYKNEISSCRLLKEIATFVLCYSGSCCQKYKSERSKSAWSYWHLRARIGCGLTNKIATLTKGILRCRNSEQVLKLSEELYKLVKNDKTVSDLLENEAKRELDDNSDEQKTYQYDFEFSDKQYRLEAHDSFSLATPYTDAAKMLEQLTAPDMGSREDLGIMSAGKCLPGREDFIREIDNSYRLRRELTQTVRAYCERRGSQSSSGNYLDARKVLKIPFGQSDIFFSKVLFKDFSTSVHILVDVSGSMQAMDNSDSSRCSEACISSLAIAAALDGIDGIKTMVTFFPGLQSEYEIALDYDDRVQAAAPLFDQSPRGSTPLAQALWYAAGRIGFLESNRNIVIVITDGVPDSVMQAKTAISKIKNTGGEIYGIGIRTEFIYQLIPESICIKNHTELRKSIFRLFKNKIFGNGSDRLIESIY